MPTDLSGPAPELTGTQEVLVRSHERITVWAGHGAQVVGWNVVGQPGGGENCCEMVCPADLGYGLTITIKAGSTLLTNFTTGFVLQETHNC